MNSSLTCRREGDHLIPDRIPPASPSIGILGERRRNDLKNGQDNSPEDHILTLTEYSSIIKISE